MNGIIFIYDVTDLNSFKNMRNWIQQVVLNGPTNVCKVLVGNNCEKPDRVVTVTKEQGKKLGDEFNIPFFEASPITGQNVKEVFFELVGQMMKGQEGKYFQNNKIIKDKKMKDKIVKNNTENNKNIKEHQKNYFEKEIDFDKKVSSKLYKFLNY